MVTGTGTGPGAGPGTGPGGLEAEGLTVRFGPTVAVRDVSLTVAPGEIVALVGPSGCGKSTLLRVLAGLESPTTGRVSWAGEDLTARPPDRRGFGLMFQDHALFPHRRVGENVAFGVRMAGRSRREQSARVEEVLALVGLAGFADRTIDTLSGGEAQRVALARSLAPSPRLVMLDEPLGSLDRTLRDRLARDLRAVLVDLGLAALHVTHDQEEAYAVADRLVVMSAGRIVRDGPAAAVWGDPGSAFVARFLGHHNVLDPPAARTLGVGDGTRAVVVREAALRIGPSGTPDTGPTRDGATVTVAARVRSVRFRGATSRVLLTVVLPGAGPVELALHTAAPPAEGETVTVAVDPAEVAVLDPPAGADDATADPAG